MRERPTATLSHTMAMVASTSVLTATPILVYAVCGLISNDMGGPLNLVIIPLMSLAFASGATLLVYLPLAALFLWLMRRHNFSSWLPVPLVLILSCAVVAACALCLMDQPPPIGYLGMATSVGGLVTVGFAAYWCTLLLARRLLKVT